MRYFLRFAYDGTAFHGSQRQPNGVTVQETMEQALAMIFREPIPLTFAGRTDAGVHAREMYAHFDIGCQLPDAGHICFRLNGILPDSIAIFDIFPVTDDAHARFSATRRTYEYHIVDHKDPFLCQQATRVRPGLDFEAMNASTDNNKIIALNNYFSQLTATTQNDYTGMLRDYNLIFICAESFSPAAVDPVYTPTLYRLTHEGFLFENYYNTFPTRVLCWRFHQLQHHRLRKSFAHPSVPFPKYGYIPGSPCSRFCCKQGVLRYL